MATRFPSASSTSQGEIGMAKVALPRPASVGRIPKSLEIGGPGKSSRMKRQNVSRPGDWNVLRSPIEPLTGSSIMSSIAPTVMLLLI